MTEQKTPKNLGGRPKEKRPHFDTALEYAMAVINDNKIAAARRDQMAVWVLRTGHQQATTEETGKKAERKQAASKAAETFNIPAAPPRQSVQ